jgi:glycine/D-amino acid oxidase-like deaminating enzyme
VVPEGDFPGLLPSPTGWLIHDTLSARLHPRRACDALAAAIRARGGRITAEPSGGQAIEVWATGVAGLAELSEALGRTVGTGVKGQAALLRADLRDAPQLFAEALHIVPHADGTVAIGSTSEREYDVADATDAQLDALIDTARRLCPALRDAPVMCRWAGVRPRARSRAPMLGAHPLKSGAFIANGGFKIGFGMAPKVAELMADLVLDGVDRIPESFRPEASL